MTESGETSRNDEGSLCTSCGICCDSTLFSYVDLKPDEIATRGHLFSLSEFGKDTGFAQPCSYCAHGGCSVYVDRPETCRDYSCPTLNAMRAGEIDTAEAQRRVATVLQIRSKIVAALRPGETINAFRQLAYGASDFKALTTENPVACMQLGMFEILLDRHFRNGKQKVMNMNTAPDAE